MMGEIDIHRKISNFWTAKWRTIDVEQQDGLNEVLEEISESVFKNAVSNSRWLGIQREGQRGKCKTCVPKVS
jgi:hypothetical protein